MQSKRRFSVILAASLVAIIFGAQAYASDDEINQEVNDLQVQLVKKPAPDATMARRISTSKKKKSLPKIAQLKKSNVAQAPVWHSDVTDNSISVLPPGPPPAPSDAPRALDKRAPVVAAGDSADIPEPPMEPGPDYQSDMTATDVPPPMRAVPDVPAQPVASDGNYMSTRVSHESGPILGGYIQRVSLLPGGTLSTLDGQDQGKVVPSTANYPVAFGGGAAALVDFDLGISPNVMFVSGAQWLMLGAQTGYAPYQGYTTFTYNDSVVLNYLAVPLEVKYLMKGEHQSGFFAQAGLQPAFLMGHTYSSYSGYSNEFRFGSYSLWDIQVTAAAGYDYKFNNHFHVVAQISGFQGFIPVFGTYSVYNVGGSAMLGIGYTL